jgi:hypothetical protein
VSRQYGASSIPTSYILDKKGNVVSRFVGGIAWNSAAVKAALDALLKQ